MAAGVEEGGGQKRRRAAGGREGHHGGGPKVPSQVRERYLLHQFNCCIATICDPFTFSDTFGGGPARTASSTTASSASASPAGRPKGRWPSTWTQTRERGASPSGKNFF